MSQNGSNKGRLAAVLGLAMALVPLACAEPEATEVEQEEGAYDPQALGKADGNGATNDFAWPLVRFDDQSRVVVAAQYLLREHGQELEVSGLFDTATELATVDFQRSKGLDDDGLIGNNTWEALLVTVRLDDQGSAAVRAVQDLLATRYGHDVDVTGDFDASTDAAVRAFQEERCLSFVDGIVGPETWNALVADVGYCTQAGRVLELHNEGEIVLLSTDFGRNDGADPLANITDAAAGLASNRSCNFPGGGRDTRLPCGEVPLDDQLIDAMVSLHDDYGFGYVVTAISGARHSPNSYHYRGRAVDIGAIDGVTIRGDSSKARAMVQACRDMGAIEALGPHNDAHHQDHIHCAF